MFATRITATVATVIADHADIHAAADVCSSSPRYFFLLRGANSATPTEPVPVLFNVTIPNDLKIRKVKSFSNKIFSMQCPYLSVVLDHALGLGVVVVLGPFLDSMTASQLSAGSCWSPY